MTLHFVSECSGTVRLFCTCCLRMLRVFFGKVRLAYAFSEGSGTSPTILRMLQVFHRKVRSVYPCSHRSICACSKCYIYLRMLSPTSVRVLRAFFGIARLVGATSETGVHVRMQGTDERGLHGVVHTQQISGRRSAVTRPEGTEPIRCPTDSKRGEVDFIFKNLDLP